MIPDGWADSKLGQNLEKIVGGGTPSRENVQFWNGDIPWATVKDLIADELSSTQEYISEDGVRNSSTNIIESGTIITATRMGLGRVIRFTEDVAINQDLKALYPLSTLHENFLFQWFKFKSREIEDMGSGSTVKGIRLEVLKDFSLLLPPLPEQKKIASILSSVDDAIQATQKVIDQTEKVKQGLLQELLTKGIGHTEFKKTEIGGIPVEWEVVSLGDFIDVQGGFAFSSKEFIDNGAQIIRMGNLYNGSLDLSRSPAFISTEEISKYPDYILNEGDIILSMTGTLGKEDYGFAVMIPQTKKQLLLNQRVCRLQSTEKFINPFLIQFYKSRLFLDQIYSLAGGTKQANLSSKHIKSVKIPLLTLSEQEEISQLFSSIDLSIETYQKKNKCLEEIKKGLMQDLLTGKVRV